MKNINISYIIIILLFIASSCETTEKIDDFPLRPSRPVLNCYFTQDSIWEFQISKSLSVLDNAELKLLKGAEIKIFKGDELIDTLSVQDYDEWYRSDRVLPETGATYSVEATIPKFSTPIRAESRLPNPVAVKSVSTQITDSSFWRSPYDDYYPVYGNVEGYFNVTIDDPGEEENYYQMSFYYMDTIYDYIDSIGEIAIGTWKNSVRFTTEEGITGDNSNDVYYFNDEVFNGQTYRIRVAFDDWNAFEGKIYYVELVSLSNEAFLYKRTIEEYSNSSEDPFAEPVIIYDNIENGYGIFAGYTTQEYAFTVF